MFHSVFVLDVISILWGLLWFIGICKDLELEIQDVIDSDEFTIENGVYIFTYVVSLLIIGYILLTKF